MTALAYAAPLVGVQTPRICSFPDYESSTGEEAIELCAMAGLYLDEGQQFVLVNSLGETADGRWAAFEVGVNEPRQNGKGGMEEARELTGLFLTGEQLLIHSAHQFDTSMEAFLRMDAILEGCPDLSRRVRTVSRSHGSEGFTLFTGQRLRYRTRTKGGGRGFTGDLLVLDEAMVLPDAFMGALLPTLSARSITGNPQVWYAGSAVDQMVHEHGLAFARIRSRGIKGDPSLAYFEWSVGNPDPDDERPFTPDRVTPQFAADPAAWAQANPGLGIRISVDHIEKERAALAPREFAVERLGVGDWPAIDGSGDSPISVEDWDALADDASRLVDPVGLAFDVTPDRSSASIAAAGARIDGKGHVEVVDQRAGTGWVVARLTELMAAHDVKALVCDGVGPAASLVPELEAAGFEVLLVSAREHANACGLIYDAVDQKTLRHLGDGRLSAAIRGASKRPLGDAWAWSRKGGTDISPLVASTLALWSVWSGVAPDPPPMVAFR